MRKTLAIIGAVIYNRRVKFMGRTFAYLKKSFWLLAAVIAVPSVAACFLSTPYWEVSFVATIGNPLMRVSDTFAVIFGDSWKFLWPVVVVSVLQIFASAFAMSAIDRHFRTGRLSLRSPWRLVNNSVFSMFLGVLIMSGISVVLRFVLFGLVTLVQGIAGAAGMSSGATLTIISVIAVGLFVLHVLAITPMLYLTPIMFIYGYRFRDAAGMSFKLIAGKKVFVGLMLPLTLCAGLQLLIGFIGVHLSIAIACNFVIFLATNVYVIAYVAVTFYEISGLERRDVKPYAAFVLPKPAPPAAEQKQNDTAASADGANADAQSAAKDKKPKKPTEPKRKAQSSDGKKTKPPADNKAEKSDGAALSGKKSAAAQSKKRAAKAADSASVVSESANAAGEGGGDGV